VTLAERVRAFLMASKPGYGRVDTEASDAIVNRSAARHYQRGHGPFQHFTVEPRPSGSPYGGKRSRQKRAAQRVASNG